MSAAFSAAQLRASLWAGNNTRVHAVVDGLVVPGLPEMLRGADTSGWDCLQRGALSEAAAEQAAYLVELKPASPFTDWLIDVATPTLLHFVGRKDNQIKHMGYRIEIEEIELALGGVEGVSQAAVVYNPVRAGFGHIVAHVAIGGAALDETTIRAALAAVLPAYMLPNRIVLVETLPKNANGKIDRASLKAS